MRKKKEIAVIKICNNLFLLLSVKFFVLQTILLLARLTEIELKNKF